MSDLTQPLRADVPERYTWDLTTIFESDESWEAEFAAVKALIPSLTQFKGKLVRSGKQVLACLTARDAVGIRLERVFSYAHLKNDQDTTNDAYKKLYSRAYALWMEFAEAVAYIDPELLKIREERLWQWVERYPGLSVYRREFERLQRTKQHTLPGDQEQLLSLLGQVQGSSRKIYGALTDSDLTFPTIDVDGEPVEITEPNYVSFFMHHPNRDVRRRAFEAFFARYAEFGNTLAATYEANVQKEIFSARARHYESTRQMALSGINVPVGVYDALVETVNANLGKMHRYAALRQRVLGLDDLHLYDMYVPLVGERKYTIEEACELVLKAVAPLGPEYVAAMRAGIEARWIDFIANKGKRGGAYSGGDYSTNPFILMNWMGTLKDVYTLIHELGHSMHSWWTRRTQPYQTGDYTLFVAEVASTTNEQLLTYYLLDHAADATERRDILNQALEGYRGTLFRQTMFAEFEMEAHARAEKGEPLTQKTLCAIYKALNDKYFGEGVVVDEGIQHEWSRIPHFYRSFYVYQYATGISAATTLARQMLTEGQPAVDRYLQFLRSGSSKDSLDLLRDAGADLLSGAPVQEALDRFESLIAEFEALSA
jgi:oligoendopeptidase F